MRHLVALALSGAVVALAVLVHVVAREALDRGREQGLVCVAQCQGRGYADGEALDGGTCECRGEIGAVCDDQARVARARFLGLE